MKKTSLVFILALLLSISTPAFASDNKVKDFRQEIKTDRKDNSLENKRTKAQATLKRLHQGIVSRYGNTLKQKAKIEARIIKIGTTRDLTLAKAKLAEFSDVKYKSDLALFDAKVVEVLASTTPLKLTPELKTLAKSLEADLKSMRQTLADALRLIIKAR